MFADRVDGAMSYIAENGNVVVADDNVIDVHGVSWGHHAYARSIWWTPRWRRARMTSDSRYAI